MEQKDLDMLAEKGFDVEGAMRRFLNNLGLYEKCLKKFLNDNSYEELKNAFEDQNCQEAFKAAHTLKGLSSNLGMDPLYQFVQPMVEKLRAGDLNIGPELEELEGLYKDTYDLVEKL